jgi:aspartate 1-decarboxylase
MSAEMTITVLKSKLSYAVVTQTELYYEGSITLDSDWMKAANIRAGEQVHVVNINNGERLVTYAIAGKAGSCIVALNGPAARLGAVGDPVFVLTYAQIPASHTLEPTVYSLKKPS